MNLAKGSGFFAALLGAVLVTASCYEPSEKQSSAPLSVTSVSPPDEAIGATVGTVITATFSQPVNPESVNLSSFTLTGPSGPVFGTISFNPDETIATFTPLDTLAKETLFTAKISTQVQNKLGDPLSAEYDWSFTTLNKGWGTAERISPAETDAVSPRIAIDAGGDAIAVWRQPDLAQPTGFDSSIWGARYVLGEGWQAAIPIEDLAGCADQPRIAMNRSGSAIAVWQESDCMGRGGLAVNHFDPGTGWGTAVRLVTADLLNPQVAIDDLGNGLVAWQQNGGGSHNIWFSQFDIGLRRWFRALPVEISTGDAQNPQVAMNGAGDAVIVWEKVDTLQQVGSIRAKRYAQQGLLGAQDIELESGPEKSHQRPSIAINGDGDIVVVWERINLTDGSNQVWGNRYTLGGWGTAGPIETGAFSAFGPRAMIDSAGHSLAVWYQSIALSSQVLMSRYDVSTGLWDDATELVPASTTSYSPEIAGDLDGNAMAGWLQGSGADSDVWVSRYSIDLGWATPELIETIPGVADQLRIAVSENGTGLAVWSHFTDGRFQVWTNRFE